MHPIQPEEEKDCVRDLIQSRLQISAKTLEEFCDRWHVVEFALFGSVLRDDFTEQSDIDVMVQFAPNKIPGLKFVSMADELEELFGRPVDLLTRGSIERSQNYIRRKAVLNSAEIIYAAK